MAIYHFAARMVQRARGHSVVQVAASRSGVVLYDDATGRSMRPVDPVPAICSVVMLPPGAPRSWSDRGVLWNAVERHERRRDAALAREVEVSLPVELETGAAVELARTFSEQTFLRDGMVVDLTVRGKQGAGGVVLLSASLLLTTRRVAGGGFGLKVTEWNDHASLRAWRAAWADSANRALRAHGFAAVLNQLSYAARGIDIEPQNKIGAVALRRARAGEIMERVEEHAEIARRNMERHLASIGKDGG